MYDFQKNYLSNYEGKELNNVTSSWSNKDDDEHIILMKKIEVCFAINKVEIDLSFCPKQPFFDEIDNNDKID